MYFIDKNGPTPTDYFWVGLILDIIFIILGLYTYPKFDLKGILTQSKQGLREF